MELDHKQAEKLKEMPLIDTKVSKSKDGKTIIVKTTITKLYSVNYFKKVCEDSNTNE